MKRKAMTNRKKDRRKFIKYADRTKKVNVSPKIMRGGFRL